ncbi:MAG: hypothetical protein AAGA77_18140 [Bacteroidota bacterium]
MKTTKELPSSKFQILILLLFILSCCNQKELSQVSQLQKANFNFQIPTYLDTVPDDSLKYFLAVDFASKLENLDREALIDLSGSKKFYLYASNDAEPNQRLFYIDDFASPNISFKFLTKSKFEWDELIDRATYDTILTQTAQVKTSSGVETKSIRSNWQLIDSTIYKLMHSPKGKPKFVTPSKFGLNISTYKLKLKDGQALLRKWAKDKNRDNNKYYNPTLKNLFNDPQINGDSTKLINRFYVDRLSIAAQVTYGDSLVATETYKYDSIPILTQFNVGRLCPPKCPPTAEM